MYFFVINWHVLYDEILSNNDNFYEIDVTVEFRVNLSGNFSVVKLLQK